MYPLFASLLRLSFTAVMLLAATISSASDQASWQVNQYNDPDNKGRTTSTLTLGIPETDAIQLQAHCVVGSSGNSSILAMVTSVGKLKDGTPVSVNFSSQDYSSRLSASVVGQQAEEGITGVKMELDNNDPLWQAMQTRNFMTYAVPGYRPSTINLSGSKEKIDAFLQDCRFYANVGNNNSQKNNEPQPSSSARDINEKEAFEFAKELGTTAAWQAYLKNFPDGFRADLAKAYIKRSDSVATASPTSPPQPNPKPKAVKQSTVDLGPDNHAWKNKTIMMDEGNTPVYVAAVESHGLELNFFCTPDKKINAILNESRSGVYPDFDGRVQRGLNSARSGNNDQMAFVPLRFDNGSQYSVSAYYMGMTGDVGVLDNHNPYDRLIEDMMSANRMTLAAPPFSATFQLKSSRAAMCNMLNRCGVKLKKCAPKSTYVGNPISTPKAKPRSQPRHDTGPVIRTPFPFNLEIRPRHCPRGTVRLEGRCINKRDVHSFCGPGYERRGYRCVQQQQRPHKKSTCPRGMVLEFGFCVEND